MPRLCLVNQNENSEEHIKCKSLKTFKDKAILIHKWHDTLWQEGYTWQVQVQPQFKVYYKTTTGEAPSDALKGSVNEKSWTLSEVSLLVYSTFMSYEAIILK